MNKNFMNTISLVFSMAWRNIMRNKRRTFLSGGALFLVSVFICLLMSIEYGSMDDMKRNIVSHETGVIRIRNPLYTKNERVTPLGLFVKNTSEIIGKVENIDGVTQVEPRIKTGVAVYTNGETKVASIIGINLQTHPFFFDKDNTLLDGSIDIISEPKARNVIITPNFAKVFDLKAGDKFTFMAKTANGGTNGYTVTVAAIVHLADNDYAGNNIFMDYKELSKLLRMTDTNTGNPNAIEIQVFTKNWDNTKESNKIAQAIQNIIPEEEVMIWTNANGYYSMLEFADIMYFFYAFIFFALAATVIFNSTMMSVLERKKEIGTLLSLGMAPNNVNNMFLLETVFISAISSFLGCVLGAIVVCIFHNIGLDLSAIGYDNMDGMNLSTMLYPWLTFGRYVEFFLTGFLTAVIACILPARMSLKVQPAEALRTEN